MMDDVFLAKTTHPKEWYGLQIDHYLKKIPLMQTEEGAFHKNVEPRFNPKQNARLQEGILPLAWHMHRFGTQNFRENIIRGLKYLLPLQWSNGAYPETNGESFSATAFITFALVKTLDYGTSFLPHDLKAGVSKAIENSISFLTMDREIPHSNQHAAALLALKEAGKIFPISESVLNRKLANILSNKDPSGLFEENDGIDLGYSTLTYSLLSTFDRSRDFYKEFTQSLHFLLFPDGTHILPMSRTHGWIVLNALEAASDFYPGAKKFAERLIGAHESGLCNATHLLSHRHILTSLYRLCEAYDNCDAPSARRSGGASGRIPVASKYLKYFRGGRIVALFYLGSGHLGYSFYLGSNRILFGYSKKSVLVEKKRRLLLIRNKRLGIRSRRSFQVSNGSLVLTNMLLQDPMYSVGPLFLQGTPDLPFSEANQNMFLRQNIYKIRLSRLKRYRFSYEDN